MNNDQELDLTLLNGYFESLGKDILQQMLSLYVQQSSEYLTNIENAMKEGSQSLWQESCHKMKGAAASAGLLLVHAKLVSMEKSAESLLAKSEYLKQLQELNIQATHAFKHWLLDLK